MNPQLTTAPSKPLKPKLEVFKKESCKPPALSLPKMDHECTQTDPSSFVTFACDLFLKELIREAGDDGEEKYQELLKKAQQIIVRIKNAAATPYGLVGGGGYGIDKKDIA